MTYELDGFSTATVAMCVFFVGHALVRRFAVLRDYAFPEPIVGGLAFAVAVAALFWAAEVEITFDLFRRDLFLVYYFAALGMQTNLREVVTHRRPLVVLVGLAAVFIVVQNVVGIAIAGSLGHHPANGIIAGSMALIGRSGTTVAWAPFFAERFDLGHVSRLGIAANMTGLIAACCIGGPLARTLIKRQRLTVPGSGPLPEVGGKAAADPPKLDHHAFLLALLRLHIAILAGEVLARGLQAVGVVMPLYVTCLIAGILLGNVTPQIAKGIDLRPSDACLTLIAYVSLGLFYTMTIMSQQLWAAGEFLSLVSVNIVVQAALAAACAYLIVFRVFGCDYDAAVISAGFVGIALGSTATTLAIMAAVATQYGRSQKPFVIVPLACGIFIDIINSTLIAVFAAMV
ncbi:MAG TPA: sodium/glutamate symporter [Rhodospirillales bacterium]|nr:sodium/glutamate symporter [Rhodospirillales bacterium]